MDLTKEDIEKYGVMFAPFKIEIDGIHFEDDENLDHEAFMEAMNSSKNAIATACPSPGEFKEIMEKNLESDGIFVVVISKELSGSYESAMLARDLFLEEHPDKKVHIINSKSAAAGQSNIFFELQKLISNGFDFEEIKNEITKFVDNMNTFFVLEDLGNLIKNGRMGKPAGFIANALSIKPVMRANDGEIELSEVSRGMKNSLNRMINSIEKYCKNTAGKRLVITHNRALERAYFVKESIKARYNFEDIKIIQNKGLSSAYAAEGGIVIAYEG